MTLVIDSCHVQNVFLAHDPFVTFVPDWASGALLSSVPPACEANTRQVNRSSGEHQLTTE